MSVISVNTGSVYFCVDTGSVYLCVDTGSVYLCVDTGSVYLCVDTGSVYLCVNTGSVYLCVDTFSPLETISTSLWASLYHHLPVLSVFSHVSCQFVFVHIFSVIVNPSPSRPPLLLFPGTTMSIIFLDKLSSCLLLICPYRCNRFCLRNVDI